MPKSKHRKKPKASSAGRPASDRRTLEALLARFGSGAADDDLDAAQELIYDAWEATDRRTRIATAKKALGISPLCADAHVLLAQEAKTVAEALVHYREGVAAGERALGAHAFVDDVGHFWGLLETRPYMRARHGLAMALWETGEKDEAVGHYSDMLRLNPGDNQGIRYLLLDALLELGRDGEAGRLIARYRGDGTAAWAWSRALSTFRGKGDCEPSRRALADAVASNDHVPAYLWGGKPLPRVLPDFIGWGDENEAIAYVHGGAAAWAAAPGALGWARGVLEQWPDKADGDHK